MHTITSGASMTVTLPFQDETGAAFTPTAATYMITDEAGGVVRASTALTLNQNDTSVTIVTTSADNTLALDQLKGLRVVTVTLRNAGATTWVSDSYVLRAAIPLRVMVNSYQSYEQAVLLATELPNLSSWALKSREERLVALTDAYTLLNGYAYTIDDRANSQSYDLTNAVFGVNEFDDLDDVTEAQFLAFPEEFQLALRKAQIAQADATMTHDVLTEERDAGLMAHSIGEVSKMYRPGRPFKPQLSKAATQYLRPWLRSVFVVSRG